VSSIEPSSAYVDRTMIARASTGVLGRTDKVTPEEDLRTKEFVIGLIWRCLAIVFLYGGLRRMKYSVKKHDFPWPTCVRP
jgi:hypothetical protein